MASRASVPLVRECKAASLRTADVLNDREDATAGPVECLPSPPSMEVEAAAAAILNGPGAGQASRWRRRGLRLQLWLLAGCAATLVVGYLIAAALRG